MRKLVFVLIFALLFVPACSKDKAGSTAGGSGAATGDVLAVIGKDKIMVSDVDSLLSNIPEPYRERYNTPEAKRDILNRLIDMKMLAYEAKKQGLDKKPVVKIRTQFLADQILANELEQSAVENTKITDADIKKYYDDNKDKFSTGPRVKVSHILVDNEKQANDILAQLKKGANFADLAKKYSKCPSAKQGGDLGWVMKGRMDPEFEKAAFALKKGQMSGVVKSSFGYHIIKCEDVKGEESKELDKVKSTIERQLKKEKQEKAVNDLKEKVKKEVKVEINEEYFKKAAAAMPKAPQAPEGMMPPQGPQGAPAPQQEAPQAEPQAPAAGK